MEEMVTRKVELDSAYAQSVLGINDDNLRVLEDQLGVGFHARGTEPVSYTHLTLPTIYSV